MSSFHHAAMRLALCGSAIAAIASIAVTPAQAESTLIYSCSVILDGTWRAEFDEVNGSFESAIQDNTVINLGDEVSLNPLTGTITLDNIADALREGGREEVAGQGPALVSTTVAHPDDYLYLNLSLPATVVPETGPITLALEGEGPPLRPSEAGTYNLVLADFRLSLGAAPEGADDYSAIWCGMGLDIYDETDPAELAFDTIEVIGPPAPSPSVTTPVETPRRPRLVQTDFAAQTPSPPSLVGPIALVGATLCGLLSIVARQDGRKSRPHDRRD